MIHCIQSVPRSQSLRGGRERDRGGEEPLPSPAYSSQGGEGSSTAQSVFIAAPACIYAEGGEGKERKKKKKKGKERKEGEGTVKQKITDFLLSIPGTYTLHSAGKSGPNTTPRPNIFGFF